VEGGAHRRHHPMAMVDAAEGFALCPGQMRGRRVERIVGGGYGCACTPSGSASWATARSQRRQPNGAARPMAKRVRGVCVLGRGPDHDGRRVVHVVTAYGWRARGPSAGGDAERVPWRSALFLFAETYFDWLKLKNFELKFKFAKYESCRPINHLQLLQG
jgi:hypothetical protein